MHVLIHIEDNIYLYDVCNMTPNSNLIFEDKVKAYLQYMVQECTHKNSFGPGTVA